MYIYLLLLPNYIEVYVFLFILYIYFTNKIYKFINFVKFFIIEINIVIAAIFVYIL
jgi:hypothetical protein